MARSQSHVLTDHDEIRRWAEERNAAPSCVRGTGGKNDTGMLRLDFPGYTGQQSLEHIDWNDWFDKFDERGLALLVQDNTASGERSNFNKLVSRATAQRGMRNARAGSRSTGRKSAARTARTSSSGSSRRKTSRKSASTKKRSSGAAARKSANSRSKRTSAKRSSRSTGRKTVSRSTSANSRSRSNARSSASTRSTSSRTRRNTAPAASRRTFSASKRQGASQSARSRRASSHVLVEHDEIRRWAEDRNAEPACVRGPGRGNDPGMIRLDFPGYTGADSLERIEWEDWFRAFDENGLALIVQDTTAGGQRSNFNKLVARENAVSGSKRGSKSSGSQVRGSGSNTGTKKAARGSNRAHRTESARGRNTQEQRKAA